jgi:hypothetical protein
MAYSAAAQRRLVLFFAALSLACAPAPRVGEAVDIAEESALILWDAARKTQHFIRRATFETAGADFGFLVPTPTVPELTEADDDAFAMLERITRGPPQAEPRKSPAPAAAAAQAAVTVIATARLAGYEAAILSARDATGLDRWLKQHGYHSSPELLEWYRPYIRRKWIITAFKIDKDSAELGRIQTSAVRMTFRTDRPFFPYREPKSASAGRKPRLLRIFVLAKERVEGRIGRRGAWPGRAVWSRPIREEERSLLLRLLDLPATTAAGALRLTEFVDASSPRPGTDDLFFLRAADQAEIEKR